VSREWVCARCGLLVHYLPGFEVPALPFGWVVERGSPSCLSCRRDAVAQEARAAAVEAGEGKRGQTAAEREAVQRLNAGLTQGTQRKARRRGSKNPGAFGRALAELRRDPNRPNAAVADAAGVGQKTVARARTRLRAGSQR